VCVVITDENRKLITYLVAIEAKQGDRLPEQLPLASAKVFPICGSSGTAKIRSTSDRDQDRVVYHGLGACNPQCSSKEELF